MKAPTTVLLLLPAVALAACAIQSKQRRLDLGDAQSARDASAEVELTLTLVDPSGRDVTAEAVVDMPPRKIWLWREGDRMGSDSREAKFGSPIRISTLGEPRRFVQLAPDATDHWLQSGWGLAGDPAPVIELEPNAIGERRLELQVAPMRRIRLTWKLPEDVTVGPEVRTFGILAPARGACRTFDFEKQVDVPVGEYELWATARAGEWPYLEMWARETVRVQDHTEPQSFVATFKPGVTVEGRFVDREHRPVAAWVDLVARSGGSPLFMVAPSAVASRPFGPPFNRVTSTVGFWSVSPDLDGSFKLEGLPPATELSLLDTGTSQPPKFSTPQASGHVGDIVVRDK